MKTVCIYVVVLLAIHAQATVGGKIMRRDEALLRSHVVAKRSIPSLVKLLGLDRWLPSEGIATEVTDVPGTEAAAEGNHDHSVPVAQASVSPSHEESARANHHNSRRSVEPLLTVNRLLHAPHQKLENVLNSLPGGNLLVHKHEKPKHQHQLPILNLDNILTSVGLQPLNNNSLLPSAETVEATEGIKPTETVIVVQPISIRTRPASLPSVQGAHIVTFGNAIPALSPLEAGGTGNSTKNTVADEATRLNVTRHNPTSEPAGETSTTVGSTTVGAGVTDRTSFSQVVTAETSTTTVVSPTEETPSEKTPEGSTTSATTTGERENSSTTSEASNTRESSSSSQISSEPSTSDATAEAVATGTPPETIPN